jgi:poly-gamma-glutamate synthesis protein (capsule biosynthesis protein)
VTTRLGLTGDVMLGRNVDRRRRSRSPDALWGDLRERLAGLDGLFVNLECALSTRGERWTRTYRPFHFRAGPSWATAALEAAGVRFAALANNHLLDYGETALLDTLDALDGSGIAHAGAGPDREAARAPAVVDVSGTRVAVVSFTDNTPEYAANEGSPGVAYCRMDPDDPEDRAVVERSLGRAREHDPDLLVASLHWGPNMEAEPSEAHREFGRWLAGEVDLVHGHSAHVFQGIEVVDGTPVLYDCGDFVDDYAVDDDLRNDRGFLFVATVEDGSVERLRLHPVEIRDCAVREAPPGVADWCRERMRERSAPFGTADEFCREGDTLILEV